MNLDSRFQVLAWFECHDAPSRYWNFFFGSWVPSRSFFFVPQVEPPETGQLDLFSFCQDLPQIVEEYFDKFLSFTYVQAHFFVKLFSDTGFR